MARLTPQDLAVWRARVTRWRESGLSAADHARTSGLVAHELRWWGWYFDGRRGPEPKREEEAPPVPFQVRLQAEMLEAMPAPAPTPAENASADELERAKMVEIEALASELRKRRLKDSPWQFIKEAPTQKQIDFLGTTNREVLFGGSAGGGKSSALLMAALQYVHMPTYSAIIFRRTYSDLALPGAVMDRAHSWLHDTGARFNDQKKTWTFPSGAKLSFGYMDTDRDRYRYQGSEFSYCGFDELTQFPEKWYRYMFSRLRKKATDTFPIRMRAASNPGGIGHSWVKKRFIDLQVEPGERKPLFIPSALDDNPHIDKKEYLESLKNLDSITRNQLLNGIWIQDSSGLVYRYDESSMSVTLEWFRDHVTCDFYILGIDYGFRDETAFCVLGWSAGDPTVYVVESRKYGRLTPSDAADIAKSLEQTYHFSKIVGDTGGLGKGYAEEAKQRFNLPIEAAQKTNKSGYIRLLIGDMERGRIKFVREANEDLFKEMSELPWREDHQLPEDGFADHLCDSFLYAWRAATAFAESSPEVETGPERGTPEYWALEEERMIARLEARLGGTEEDVPYWAQYEIPDPKDAWIP